MIEEDPMGKRLLGKRKLRKEDGVKKDVKKIEPKIRWWEAAVDRVRRQDLCLAIWSQRPKLRKKKINIIICEGNTILVNTLNL